MAETAQVTLEENDTLLIIAPNGRELILQGQAQGITLSKREGGVTTLLGRWMKAPVEVNSNVRTEESNLDSSAGHKVHIS